MNNKTTTIGIFLADMVYDMYGLKLTDYANGAVGLSKKLNELGVDLDTKFEILDTKNPLPLDGT